MKKVKKVEVINAAAESEPLMVAMGAASGAPSSKVRRNAASSIERLDKYINIENGFTPFTRKGNNVSVKETVELCQKAYYNIPVFRNIIDLMTEFSCNNIFFKKGSAKSRQFFEAYFDKININDLQDRFFREYFRSGNVFVYKMSGNIEQEDLAKITQTFGLEAKASTVQLPVRYIILNPVDIETGGTVSFLSSKFYKILSSYELERLRNPKTNEDEEVLSALDPKLQEQIKKRTSTALNIELDPEKFVAVFYKKQDYEPFAVPMGFPVLDDINWKEEMKRMDKAIARTMQQAVLLVTAGTEPEKGGVNQKNLQALQTFFENESVGRVIIADYTTKIQFIIPEIANLLDPKKYEVVDRDIHIGLNNILVGDEKFANQSIKVKIFVERLRQSRESFLKNFLIPEIKKIAQTIGLKNYPTPYFQDFDLDNDLEYSKLFTRMMELGILTPQEGFEAIKTGRLPSEEESEEAQQKYKGLRDKDYYKPLLSKPETEEGRPTGTKAPQSTKKVKPIGANVLYSLTKIKDNLLLAQARR